MSPLNGTGTTSIWQKPAAVLLMVLPTVNAVLLTIQAFISEPPFNSAVPGWVFASVNAAVTLAAFAVKLMTQLMANPLVSEWVRKMLVQTRMPGVDLGPKPEVTVADHAVATDGGVDRGEVDSAGMS